MFLLVFSFRTSESYVIATMRRLFQQAQAERLLIEGESAIEGKN